MNGVGTFEEEVHDCDRLNGTDFDVDSNLVESAGGSQSQPSASLASLSLEERLKRTRAAAEQRQKQRYEAYLQSQRQAELARIKAQEDRKKKIEEIHQRAEARRQSVLERRKELELSTKARLESLLERSRSREAEQVFPRRRTADVSIRTASASPSLGSARQPNHLMTSSCVVAFGSSAPRSTFSHNRSTSTNECNKLGRPPTAPSSLTNGHPAKKPESLKPARSATDSQSSSVRSVSSDTLAKRVTQPIPSVFERLTAQTLGRKRPDRAEPTVESRKVSIKQRNGKLSNGPQAGKRLLGPTTRLPANGMSVSVYSDRTDRKRAPARVPPPAAPARQRSVSPVPVPTESDKVPDADSPKSDRSLSPNRQLVIVSTETSPPVVISPEDTTTVHQEAEPAAVPAPVDSATEVLVDVASESQSVPASKSDASVSSSVTHSGPLVAETQSAGDGGLLSATEQAIYRAKLIEQRRLAKERKEEEQRRLEEEQLQRRLQQEAEREAAEQAEREQAELAAQQAAEAQRQREEEEKARLREAEAERLAKLQRAEEERELRKQRLANIMSRVKPTSGSGGTVSPNVGTTADEKLPPAHSLSTKSSPFLSERHEPTVDAAHGDVSDSVLYSHSRPDQPANVIVESDSESRPSTDPPVSFSLYPEPETVDQMVLSTTGDAAPVEAQTNPIQYNGKGGKIETPSRSPHSPILNVSPTPDSPSKSSPAMESTAASTFKSPLLRSMLGGGRLTTRAKDAVEDNRRRDAFFEVLGGSAENEKASLDHRAHSTFLATDAAADSGGESPRLSALTARFRGGSPQTVNNTGFPNTDVPEPTKVTDDHLANTHIGTDEPALFAWSPGANERENNGADSITSSVALSTPTH